VKVVLDTNVLVAGLLSPFGPPGEIVRLVASGTLSLCFDARILSEYAEVLTRPKFQFEQEQIHILLDQIRAEGEPVAGKPLPLRLPDESDEPFLEAALAGNAVCVITGNLKHFPIARCRNMKILSPNGFLDYYRKEMRPRKPKG
jgi:putative PIN family toxin of toxin-antitoxin system